MRCHEIAMQQRVVHPVLVTWWLKHTVMLLPFKLRLSRRENPCIARSILLPNIPDKELLASSNLITLVPSLSHTTPYHEQKLLVSSSQSSLLIHPVPLNALKNAISISTSPGHSFSFSLSFSFTVAILHTLWQNKNKKWHENECNEMERCLCVLTWWVPGQSCGETNGVEKWGAVQKPRVGRDQSEHSQDLTVRCCKYRRLFFGEVLTSRE